MSAAPTHSEAPIAAGALHRAQQIFERERGQWILDTAAAKYDQAWLDHQQEIGLRHHRTKKNRTDGARAAEHIPFHHLLPLAAPIVSTLRPFLAKGGHSPEDVGRMQEAWLKSVLVQLTLWSAPYLREGDF